MDPRRRVMALIATGLLTLSFAAAAPATASDGAMAPAPNPMISSRGRPAILEANRTARAASQADRFSGALQVFDYAPGRIYEVWTAPLRVTTLSLGVGETIVALAAGDTVRWQIAEASSGDGAGKQAHVLIKPLSQGLETNLVLTTSDRIYLIALRSGGVAAFNSAVAWSRETPPPPALPDPPQVIAPQPPLQLDADYRIEVRGRRPAWTPVSVVSDGTRTLIVFPAKLASLEAPALFALSEAGAAEMVNYRQAGRVFIIDRVLQRAELRAAGGGRSLVRIVRTGAAP